MFHGLKARVKTTCFPIENTAMYRLINSVKKNDLTYVDTLGLIDIYHTISDLRQKGVGGVFIEAGCALGGSAIVICASKEKNRPFNIYDVFGMIPAPSKDDGADVHNLYNLIISGQSEGIGGDKYYGYQKDLISMVKDTFKIYNLSIEDNKTKLIKGLFQDTMHVNEPVAFAHIDGDWYASTMTCLERIEPKLSLNGVMIIDDYDHWSGCK